MDRAQLADFLRTRREALQPEDVGLPRGSRRRTGGLRREEVAVLADMSADYYGRIEQQRGPKPSEQMLASLARGLRLSTAERDHLFRLGGYVAPGRLRRGDHVEAGLMRILDRLVDVPAMVVGSTGETLVQTPPCVALLGDETAYEGLARCVAHRWWTLPEARLRYPAEDQGGIGRAFTAELRAALTRDGAGSLAAEVVADLEARSPEFRAVWAEHEVARLHSKHKRIVHPDVGVVEVFCQTLYDVDQDQGLLLFTATPGTESSERLKLLGVIGAQSL
ncbi:helix-turn-helix transcriptional regulator [Nocardioides dongxiaopingii]|uniref:helix-turn-helix transcriptional regulator n=1 Tax=Nocardioides dongxiaopingii TaxID=2576036 RepID=UPI0010C76C8F|nr:helix-turn-helix transcriptional regulator [Nocardioides dongxiaopingii]